ncbi:MAG: M20/M25/M40 family metallo-hydrolase [Deltaproteobacteria bacterium]|nr:M20/M25/M40 family metallo-hydrolase [Deltaproteobacteria bacterium]
MRRSIAALREEFASKLAALVALPSVSVEPGRHGDVRRCARLACSYLRDLGAQAAVIETGGLPLVWGRIVQDPAFPTVTVYNHLDVQPADGDGWRTSPFALARVGDRYFGRGATDDKGPLLAALFGARLALAASVRLNFHFLWECEEEIGSPSFAVALAALAKGSRQRPALRTDSVVVSDTIWPSAQKPAIAYGLRGLLGFLVRLRTGETAVHSGTTGGAARNPVAELAALLAGCHEARTGRIHIPGFFDEVRKLRPAERRELARSGLEVAAFRKAHGLRSLRVADDRSLAEAIMARPTFEVHGIVGGYGGPGIKTIVPHEAEAKLSCRLVPGQRPRQVFRRLRRFIADKCPDAEVVFESALEPYLADSEGPFLRAAGRAMRETFGRQPALTREGGSIGAVVTMAQILRKEVVLLGLSLPEDGYHAPNESFAWPQAGGGIELFYRYFHHLAALGRGRKG